MSDHPRRAKGGKASGIREREREREREKKKKEKKREERENATTGEGLRMQLPPAPPVLYQ